MKMKIFQQILSSGLIHQAASFSLKASARGSAYKICSIRNSCFNVSCPLKFPVLYYASCSMFHTTGCVRKENVGLPLPAPKSKKRLQRKKDKGLKDDLKEQTSSAVAYSTAEEYKMVDLTKALQYQELYQCLPLPKDAGNDLHLCLTGNSNQSHIYIFSEGCVVFWNVPESKRKEFLNFLKPFETNAFEESLIDNEKEDLDYLYSEEEESTRFYDGVIILNSKTDSDLYTYTFSNSLAQSVKLGMLEAALEKYSDSIEWVTEKMKKGEKIKMSRNEIFAKRGELFALRHDINLSSDLLDTPDFYWDRKDLEILYQQTRNYLDIPLRTRTMNVRLSYCSELVDLLGNHMNDEHHVRLEWMIIVLIMVEVVFECMHFVERLT